MAAPELIQRTDPHRSGRAKRLARVLFGIAAAPIVGLYHVTVALLPDRRDDVFQGFSQFMSLWPGLPGDYFRLAFYRWTLSSCSPNASIGFGTIFATPDVAIGHDVYIGARCLIAHATIHDDVLIGSNVDIVAGKHQHHFDRMDVPIRLQGGRYEPVSIGPDAWIGNGATVTQSVGAHAIVAAGAVVVKAVDEADIVGGNPARVITHRTHGSSV
jgi:acetyltransferase-like isoleucine patch superfamily enzyme